MREIYTHQTLVFPNDPGYLRQCHFRKKIFKSHKNKKAYKKDILQRDYQESLTLWESVVQKLLSSLVEEKQQRILRYFENGVRKYKEIDFITKDEQNNLIFCEIKLKQQYKNEEELTYNASGWRQLNKTITIIDNSFGKTGGLSLCVDMSSVLDNESDSRFTQHCKISQIKDFIMIASEEKNIVWLDFLDIVQFSEKNLLTDSADLIQLKERFSEMNAPYKNYSNKDNLIVHNPFKILQKCKSK